MIQKSVAHLKTPPKTLSQFKQLHAHLLKSSSSLDPLFSIAATNPSLFSHISTIFHHTSKSNRTTFICNNMIRGYLNSNSPLQSLTCYLDMLGNGISPNWFTYPPLIKSCFGIEGTVCLGDLVHAHVVVLGFERDGYIGSALVEMYAARGDMGCARKVFDKMPERDMVVGTGMVDGYGKAGEVEEAWKVFEGMRERNEVTWSVMMAGFLRAGEFGKVVWLFGRMQDEGARVNEAGLVSVVAACAHLSALAQGVWVHEYVKRCGFERNCRLATALVDMYSKCGSVDVALSVFEEIQGKDLGAWNAIIYGVAMNGEARKSLGLFNRMVLSGIKPNETTFISILSACTHAKLVHEGLTLFHEMKNVYHVEPRLEHYACMVDLLARAGMVEEAEKLVEEKIGGLEAGDANVWGALLGACRIHSKVEIGKRVWSKLASRRVADSGAHVLSYGIYREAGREGEAESIRKSISESGLKKKPGCSIIGIDGSITEFRAGDLSHPKGLHILQVIDSWSSMLFSVTVEKFQHEPLF